MRRLGSLVALIIATALLPGCASGPVSDLKAIFQNKGDAELAAGIKSYEDARYPEATRSLQSALQAGLSDSSQVKAHKYLAFIQCASGREKQCRDEFAKALAIDPALELEPAEAGHPIWGPVFRSLKNRR